MSEWTKERWHTCVREGNIYNEGGAQVAHVREARTASLALIADHIVVNHNACIDIPNPETTVPELVAFVRMVADYGHDEDCASYIGDECDCFSEKAIALLAKTGKA